MKAQAVKRQGDILLVPVKKLPANLTEVPRQRGRIVLAEGETTTCSDCGTVLLTVLSEVVVRASIERTRERMRDRFPNLIFAGMGEGCLAREDCFYTPDGL